MHAVAGEQGAHAAVPCAYVPTGQVDAVYAQEVAPCALKAPAAQLAQAALEAAPVALDHVPAAQGVGCIEERGQKAPAGQGTGAPEAQ